MKFEIINIGNELTCGDTLNTNASWLSEQLYRMGFTVGRHTIIADHEKDILNSFRSLFEDTTGVIITGGLGPTVDDLTLEVASQFFGVRRVLHESSLQQIENFLKTRNCPMRENQKKQAYIFEGSTALQNPLGTAPGVYFKRGFRHFFFLPGVPAEMKAIFGRAILPILKKNLEQNIGPSDLGSKQVSNFSKILRCFGCEEAKLDELLQPLFKNRVEIDGCSVAFRLVLPDILIKISSQSCSVNDAQEKLKQAVLKMRSTLGDFCYGEDEDSLEQILVSQLGECRYTFATAESCTGGLIAHRITQIPGCSKFFLGGIVAYSNTLKRNLLHVSEKTLSEKGAVSKETAIEMALGVKQRTGADLTVSVTGIAGPDGGSETKPVGTVHLALAYPDGCESIQLFLPFERSVFKNYVSSVALNWVRKFLNRREMIKS